MGIECAGCSCGTVGYEGVLVGSCVALTAVRVLWCGAEGFCFELFISVRLG